MKRNDSRKQCQKRTNTVGSFPSLRPTTALLPIPSRGLWGSCPTFGLIAVLSFSSWLLAVFRWLLSSRPSWMSCQSRDPTFDAGGASERLC